VVINLINDRPVHTLGYIIVTLYFMNNFVLPDKYAETTDASKQITPIAMANRF